MNKRIPFAALALSLVVTACDRDAPTSPATGNETQNTAPTAAPNIARQALVFPASQVMPAPALDDGIVYTLTSIQVTHIARNTDPLTRGEFKLAVNGLYTFTNPATGATRTEPFSNRPANLTSSGSPTAATCDILTLDIGRVHLDLLGLVVDLAPVHLRITAQSGPGNLLGNLLCAVTHLLDQNPLAAALTNLLNTINNLLMQLV
jgi:hypothetical protein